MPFPLLFLSLSLSFCLSLSHFLSLGLSLSLFFPFHFLFPFPFPFFSIFPFPFPFPFIFKVFSGVESYCLVRSPISTLLISKKASKVKQFLYGLVPFPSSQSTSSVDLKSVCVLRSKIQEIYCVFLSTVRQRCKFGVCFLGRFKHSELQCFSPLFPSLSFACLFPIPFPFLFLFPFPFSIPFPFPSLFEVAFDGVSYFSFVGPQRSK